jgi:hypothetical protein
VSLRGEALPLVAGAILAAFVAGGVLCMRREMRPIAGSLVTPRPTSLRYALSVGAPALPAITRGAPGAEEAPRWVVLGWRKGRQSESFARAALAHAGALVRCTRMNPPCDGAVSDEEDVSLCAESEPFRRLNRCRPHDCERLTLVSFFQKTTQIDPSRLRQTCQEESDRWLDWNPPEHRSKERP